MKPLLLVCLLSTFLLSAEAFAGQIRSCADYSAKTLNRKADPYKDVIAEAAKKYKVSPALIKAVITAESCFKDTAVSPMMAAGLMQLMPDTADRFDVIDVFDPVENIHAGTRYLRWLLRRYEGSMIHAVAAYNAGEGRIPHNEPVTISFRETRDYIGRVLTAYTKLEKDKKLREEASLQLSEWQESQADAIGVSGRKGKTEQEEVIAKTIGEPAFRRDAKVIPAVTEERRLPDCRQIPESVTRLTRPQGNGRYRVFVYPVPAGETLFRAADKLSVSLEEIIRLNTLNENVLPTPGYPLKVAECMKAI